MRSLAFVFQNRRGSWGICCILILRNYVGVFEVASQRIFRQLCGDHTAYVDIIWVLSFRGVPKCSEIHK